MNFLLLFKLLSRIVFLIAATMVFSLPWAFPVIGGSAEFEFDGFFGLLGAVAIALIVGGFFWYLGRTATGSLYRKEAMAVVGLSWILATALGAMPYLISRTEMAPGQVMQIWDACFESQSGFSTTGATVLTDVEMHDGEALVPRSILFWRSSTHFLGGMGIIVLFVAILGQGSAGKTLMRSEIPGPTKDGPRTRMQQTAWIFATIYIVLTAVLSIFLACCGLSWFDSFCTSFGTMATGGFSTYNNSIGHFAQIPSVGPIGAAWAESIIMLFMVIAGTNFTLLYFMAIGKPLKLLKDVEWRTYITTLFTVSLLILFFGYLNQDHLFYYGENIWKSIASGIRQSSFQVVSIMTTTGFSNSANFDEWNNFGRGTLLLLMFIGGCAGSTGGGLKVIRHIMFLSTMRLELEKSYHPTVVRPLRLGGQPVEDKNLRKNILVYFGLILIIFVFSWLFLITTEPDATWIRGGTGIEHMDHKLIDCASSVAATLNNVGPGLGTVGPKYTYTYFTPQAKVLFIWLMMIGRLEIFTIFVLFLPGFWRNQ
jgi:trk system potassium uptake protein TrkH